MEVQDNLLQKREGLNQTESLTPLISSDDSVIDIIERVRLKQDNREIMEEQFFKEPPIIHFIPPFFQSCTFGSFKNGDKYIQQLKKWNEAKDDICIYGTTGSGKTHLAIALYRESKEEAKFITVPELLLEIRGSFKDDSSLSEKGIVMQYASYPVLILDDLGAEKTSEYSMSTLYLILDRRIRYARQTIITTNLSLQEIEENMGARTASRIAGMRNIKINMPDYRKKR